MKNPTITVIILVLVALLIVAAAAARIHELSLPASPDTIYPATVSSTTTSDSSTVATSTASSTPPIIAVSYICEGGKTIDASFYNTPDATSTVALTLSDGRFMTLPQVISADGARYANADESFVFWSKGDGALVFENGQEKDYMGCVAATR